MIELILILLVVAAIAALFGMGRLSGLALNAAQILIVVALVVFLLLILGVFSLA